MLKSEKKNTVKFTGLHCCVINKFEQNLHDSKFDAITAIARFAPGCKISANPFSSPIYRILIEMSYLSIAIIYLTCVLT